MESGKVLLPLDVPKMLVNLVQNYLSATKNSGRLMLKAANKKVEHLNDDF